MVGAKVYEGDSLEDGVSRDAADVSVAGEARDASFEVAALEATDCCRTWVDSGAAEVVAAAVVGASKEASLLAETGTRTTGPLTLLETPALLDAGVEDAMAETDADVSVALSACCAAAIAMQRATEVRILFMMACITNGRGTNTTGVRRASRRIS